MNVYLERYKQRSMETGSSGQRTKIKYRWEKSASERRGKLIKINRDAWFSPRLTWNWIELLWVFQENICSVSSLCASSVRSLAKALQKVELWAWIVHRHLNGKEPLCVVDLLAKFQTFGITSLSSWFCSQTSEQECWIFQASLVEACSIFIDNVELQYHRWTDLHTEMGMQV